MTKEPASNEFRTPTVITPSGTQFDKDWLQLADWLDDYQRRKTELEVYKKALKMACTTISNFTYHHPENHVEEEMNNYLRKASE